MHMNKRSLHILNQPREISFQIAFIDIDECAENSDQCDRSTTTCQNSAGSYSCPCFSGYDSVDGFKCYGDSSRRMPIVLGTFTYSRVVIIGL